jgi:hypothetical protein
MTDNATTTNITAANTRSIQCVDIIRAVSFVPIVMLVSGLGREKRCTTDGRVALRSSTTIIIIIITRKAGPDDLLLLLLLSEVGLVVARRKRAGEGVKRGGRRRGGVIDCTATCLILFVIFVCVYCMLV